MRRLKTRYTTGECPSCFGSGLNPANVDDNCPKCHGYGQVPVRVESWMVAAYEPFQLADRQTIIREIER